MDGMTKILNVVALRPDYDKEKIAEKTGLAEGTVKGYIYSLREVGKVVKASDVPYYRRKGYRWMITGKGMDDLLEQLKSKAKVYRPKHKRSDEVEEEE